MSHMVIYRGSDGKPGYHQTDDIHDAVGFVEQMRNDQGVEHARIFRLEEVVFQYKPYYRVELAESGFDELAMAADGSADVESTDLGPTNGFEHLNGATDGNGSGNGGGVDTGDGLTTDELLLGTGSSRAESTTDVNGTTDRRATVGTVSEPLSMPSTVADDDTSKRGLFGR